VDSAISSQARPYDNPNPRVVGSSPVAATSFLRGLRHTSVTVALGELKLPVTRVSSRPRRKDVKVTPAVDSHALCEQDEAVALDVACSELGEGRALDGCPKSRVTKSGASGSPASVVKTNPVST
jgi:hypothetical protein